MQNIDTAKSENVRSENVRRKRRRKIRTRESLSFTKRNAMGHLINWTVPPQWIVPSREGDWKEHYGIGEFWFREIIELTRHNPEAGYHALCSMVRDMALDENTVNVGRHRRRRHARQG